MELAVGILITAGIAAMLLFLYSLMKIAHQSDVRAGYAEGMLYEKVKSDHQNK